MKITKQVVKTIVSIKLDSIDFFEMIDAYKQCEEDKKIYPNAFKNMCVVAEMKEEHIIKVMKEMLFLGNKDTFNYIASFNGFDGWENSGYYDEKSSTYNMVVYNYGDTMN